MNMNEQLKPCPFCGSKAEFDSDDNGFNWIECTACHTCTKQMVSAMEDCKPLLIEQWNMRKQLPEGIWLNNKGETCAECCRCKKSFVVDYVNELPQEEIYHYCGGSERCCP